MTDLETLLAERRLHLANMAYHMGMGDPVTAEHHRAEARRIAEKIQRLIRKQRRTEAA
jgi:hypothetical protein